MPEWTPAQQNAISARDGTILVSAAAGSGKTAVLVERVIQRIEDEKNPCPADSLLIVTFTKAATAQMREKITAALDKRIELDPDNEHLLKQRMLLPFASISTIDGFCGDLVKENFHELGISPDYKIAEEAELNLMKQDAAEIVLEKAYKEKRDGFSQLISMMFSGDDDSPLRELMLSLYNTSRAYAYPEKWLDSFVLDYEQAGDFKDTVWGRYLVSYIRDICDYHIEKLNEQIALFNDDMKNANGELFYEYVHFIESFCKTLDSGSWNDIVSMKDSFCDPKIKNVKSYDRYEEAKNARDAAKKDLKSIFEDYLYCSQEEFEEDAEVILPAVKELIRLIKEFDEEFSRIKKDADAADFSDICAYALKLLVKEVDSNGNPVKTELAQAVSERYTEILVDEFQDINEQQNLLFKVLSRNESNLFMVGDVKQSIYKFRLAMPEIFINTKKAFPDFDGGNYPARINLDYNFRSRKGVTDFVNFVFSQLMSEKAGDIDYDVNEELKPKAEYPEDDSPDAEIHILRESEDEDKTEYEAEYTARYIENAMKSGMTVKDGDSVRRVQYKDFCILLKTAKNKMDIYSSALKKRGIPCYASNAEGFFKATEVRTVLSIMRIVDNPLQDIPLAAAMISPVFGFTPDELAAMRNDSPNCPYWICVRNAAENGMKKSRLFVEEIKRLRTLSVTLGSGEFLRELLDSTGYLSTVRAMSNGSQRAANLSLLLDYAEKYEQSGHIGLSGFIRFIDRVEKNKKDFEVAKEISENADVVRLMTVHKSKGLEFPVCILADCSEKFQTMHTRNSCDYLLHSGIGFRRVSGEKKFKTLPYSAVTAAHSRSNRSEELRLLYVALTRAKEKMVCIMQYKNPEKEIEKAMAKLGNEKKISPVSVLKCSSFSDMLLLASLRHFDSNDEPAVSGCRTADTLPCESSLLFEITDGFSEEIAEADAIVEEKEADSALLDIITERIKYEYPYSNLSSLVAKVSPSQLENTAGGAEYFAKTKPQFLTDSSNGGASKGTAVHKFMEFYDYASEEKDVRTQADIMVRENKLSENEKMLLDFDRLSAFFRSRTAERISLSSVIEREKKITFCVGADEIYGEKFSSEEKIVVQGYIDCAFIENGEWVIVDYKTDRVKAVEELTERYSGQLKMYERALLECTGIPVKETVIYSLFRNEAIVLN